MNKSILIALLLLPAALWMTRNYAHTGYFYLSENGAFNMANVWANHARGMAYEPLMDQLSDKYSAYIDEGKAHPEKMAGWNAETWATIKARPLHAAGLALWDLRRAFLSDLQYACRFAHLRRPRPMIWAFNALWLAIEGLVGFLFIRQCWRDAQARRFASPALLALLFGLGLLVLYFGTGPCTYGRFRYPLWPLMLLLVDPAKLALWRKS